MRTKSKLPKPKIHIKENYVDFVNINRFYSYSHCNTFMLTGGRGIGKTTGLDIKVVKNWINYDEEFVYIRRYVSEIKKSKSLLDKIIPNVTIRGMGDGVFEFMWNKQRIGFAIALSVQQSVKSGVDFSKVTTSIYDEAILKRGGTYRYLQDEVHEYFELMSTIFRDRTNYKMYLLGNNADMFNPYNSYFKVPRLSKENNIYVDKDRGLYVEHMPTKKELLEKEKDTPLYRLTQGTNYSKYHYDNEVITTGMGKIDVKNKNAYLLFRIVYNDITLNIYEHNTYDIFVEIRNKIIKDNKTFVIMENNKPNYMYIKLFRQSPICKYMVECFYNNDIYYEDDKAVGVFDLIVREIK